MRNLLAGAALAAFIVSASGSGSHARKTESDRLRMEPGQSWSIEDTLLTRITDPQTGVALTPSVRGVFRYSVEKNLADGSSVIGVKIISLQGGTSMKSLVHLPVEHPERPEQGLLATSEGELYGLYPIAEKPKLAASPSVADWLLTKPGPAWVWYKFPGKAIDVGSRAKRTVKGEVWDIARLEDESVGGVDCAVYEATLKAVPMKVVETTWFDRGSGTVVKRELSETRAKGVYSTLTQVRL